jgi:hypothetical protein
VWGTKYRRKFLKEYIKLELLAVFGQVMKKYPKLQNMYLDGGIWNV